MFYAGPKLPQGVRLTSRGANPLLVRRCGYGTRPLSTVLSVRHLSSTTSNSQLTLSETNHRSCLVQVSLASRNFSLWPSSKTNPTSIPSSPLPPPGDSVEKPNGAEILSGTPPVEPTTNAPTADVSSTIAEPIVPESTSILDSGTIVTDVFHDIPVPLQFGDFAALGLSGWSPAGIIRWSFEILNVASGLPWFWTIVAGSAIWRLVCVPFAIKAAKTAAIMQPRRKEIAALQERAKQTAASKNPAAVAKANREMRDFYSKLGVSPFGGLVGFLQLPVSIGIFFAVKKLCDLPVEQLRYSGFDMFPDLTVTDPTLILPISMTLAVNAQLLFGSRDVASNMRPLMYFFHFLTIPGFFLLKGLPVGLILSILTTGILTTVQTLLMRVPHVRRALGMPVYVPLQTDGPSILDTLKTLLSKDGDIKVKVAEARRREMRKNVLQKRPKNNRGVI